MASLSYEYQKPQNTYTLDQFINCKSDTIMNYNNSSFLLPFDDGRIMQSTYNVVSDYLDELRDSEYTQTVQLSDEELMKYKYKPKLLAYDLYGNGEAYFIILLINDMSSVKQFTKDKLLLPTQSVMKTICSRILNANREAIAYFNKNNAV